MTLLTLLPSLSQMLEAADFNPVINRAFLIGIQTSKQSLEDAEILLDELIELVSNLDIGIVGSCIVKIRESNPRYLVGTGKMQELLQTVQLKEADSIIFDEELSPAQQRNWENAAESKLLVIDRQEIILDIFNKRAQTREARLQVQLARMQYDLPRMKRAWTHLDRQKGGSAMQRDAGEKQIEVDQRLIRQRISRVKKELKEVVQHRQVQRKKRMKVPFPTAAIIGYTNAGKSSLLNALTQSKVLAEDKLFATLDPTTRRMVLPSGQPLLLTDTVGFVRRLPHRLVDAFKATLEEAVVSNFLIHVLDASSPDLENHYHTTLKVIEDLGALECPRITVFNKIDLLETPADVHKLPLEVSLKNSISISVKTGQSIAPMLDMFESMLKDQTRTMHLCIPHSRYDVINLLHKAGCVQEEKHETEGVYILGNVPPRLAAQVDQFQIKEPT